MSHDEDISRLEQYVENLLTSYNELKKEHQALELRLQESESENKELQENLAGLQDARQVMRSRVTGLIDRIETWEKGAGDLGGDGSDSEKKSDVVESTPENSMPIFSTGVGSET